MYKRLLSLLLIIATLGCSDTNTTDETTSMDREWWKEGIIYQIYPRSFKDTDGDGIGDLRGVIEKLDYIESLGVSMVWMNPFFNSPMVDNGYDVSDYRAILPEFGSMDDFNELLEGLHERNIKFVLDVVVNHSSNQHEWFKQSRSSRDNPYRDYYHWWPAEKGEPPYRYSLFDPTGNAWKYDSLTNAYYLHYFAAEQPDLKWENPEVRKEVYDIMKFWADKGVDGFRLDAFQFVSKDITYPEWPEGWEKDFIQYYGMGPNLHDYLREMNEEIFSKYDVFSVSEGAGSTFEDAHNLVDADRNELQMAYHFKTVDIVNSLEGYELAEMKQVFSQWDSAFAKEGWISIFLSNHDVARLVSRFGNDSAEFRALSTQLLNTHLLSMRGTPYTYYGDELGMTNMDMTDISEYNDIAAKNSYLKALSEGQDMEQFMKQLNFLSRDNGRTPMQWDASANAGFTTGTPWLPVNNNHTEINVASQEQDPNSVLNHFRKMTQLRNENLVLVYGSYQLLLAAHEQIYAYTRTLGDDKMLILLNFSEQTAQATLPGSIKPDQVMINNYGSNPVGNNGDINLKPYQAVVMSLK
jgi:oligo-1,6-glucosidase